MSKREWKAGDVALVNDCTRPESPWEAATCIASQTHEREPMWRLHSNGGEVWGSVSQARPLVVIDPEDTESVERLSALYVAKGIDLGYAMSERQHEDRRAALHSALREFANPTPPIDEPLGLGAVVEDTVGRIWVFADTTRSGLRWHGEDGWRTWDELNPVRVLSEGVRP